MKNSEHRSQARPLLSQSRNNTTLWIGHLHTDPKDHFAGQTFICPSSGILDNIQILTSVVQKPGNVHLTLHEFDPKSRTWGTTIG
ncbi:MAG TPA: hypothetical protein VFO70_03395, partial [Chitinophagaceae bacterium]|nr:hypothetical protein [Chitinophagaceae bacterium]